MKRIYSMVLAVLAALMLGAAAQVGAQAPAGQSHAYDPSARLREVLPPDVADRVLAKIAEARSRGLPAQALERTALKGAAREVPPADIERAVDAQAERLERSQQALSRAHGGHPSDEEIEAGAEAVRHGVDGKSLSQLASSAPSGRSLVVPLHVLGSLVERGLPCTDAINKVIARMTERASDAQLAQLPEQVGAHPAGKPDETGRELAAGQRRMGMGGGRPAGVPANAGAGARPSRPATPGGRP
jgi:hypothetical protein